MIAWSAEDNAMRRITAAPWLITLAVLAGCSKDPSETASSPNNPKAEDSGRVTMHRLNRFEYNNTVRDLLGTAQRPADDFPADDHSYGFDDIADVLTISPLQLELYERAADALATEAMAVPTTAQTTQVEAETLSSDIGAATGDYWNLWSSGVLSFTTMLPADGDYVISTRVYGDQAGPEPVKISVNAGSQSLGTYDVVATSSNPTVITLNAKLKAGSQVIGVEFLNDFYDPTNNLDRNLLIDWIKIEGPLDVPGKNPIRDRIVTCDPKTGEPCQREILAAFAKKAWRRPVIDAEIDALMSLVKIAVDQKDTIDAGLTLAVRAILLSPHFLFRPELDADPLSTTAHPLTGFELASRLSYFLWSSMPDDALLAAAESGKLADPAEIEAQVDRLLADPKSEAFIDSFGGQWLYTRALADHLPDYQTFPQWNDALRESMKTETQLFFRELVDGDHPLETLLTADFAYLNDQLATLYGLDALGAGPSFKRHDLPDGTTRGGLLAQASWLTVTSYPARTSPVKRGKWVMGQLLCAEPPPPPPGVKPLAPEKVPTGSFRQRLEQHRSDPTCASCHTSMDPIGFALEAFDAIGVDRKLDAGFPIDTTGELPGGVKIDGARDLAGAIAKDPRFLPCVTSKVFTYGLGRAPTAKDTPFLNHIGSEATARGKKLKDIIRLVATSEPFRMRRGEK